MSRRVTFAGERDSEVNNQVSNDWEETLEGLRDPNMTTKQRKMVRIWAHLGLETFKDMKKDQKNLEEAVLRLGEEIYQNRGITESEAVIRLYGPNGVVGRQQRFLNILTSLKRTLNDHWTFLFKLPANFERFNPDGIKFLLDLMELDPDRETEVGPIAVISMEPELNDS